MDKSKLETFKQRVEILLIQRGLTKRQLASALGVSMPALYQLLDRSSPRIETLNNLAYVLGVDISELIRPVTPSELGSAMLRKDRAQ